MHCRLAARDANQRAKIGSPSGAFAQARQRAHGVFSPLSSERVRASQIRLHVCWCRRRGVGHERGTWVTVHRRAVSGMLVWRWIRCSHNVEAQGAASSAFKVFKAPGPATGNRQTLLKAKSDGNSHRIRSAVLSLLVGTPSHANSEALAMLFWPNLVVRAGFTCLVAADT